MACALISALANRALHRTIAMTGEITLRGRVLPVGGVKEKVLGAYRAGISQVILPKKNERELVDIPRHVRRKLRFALVEHMDAVLPLAFLEIRSNFLISHASAHRRMVPRQDNCPENEH
jgi:ATP-dependent Lon protease